MAVAARTVNSLTEAANAVQDVASGVRAGTYYLEVGDDEIVDGWHTHEFHQLEYAIEGVAAVETTNARYLVPPRQALWIPAGVEHCSTLTRLKAVSVFFDPSVELRVFSVDEPMPELTDELAELLPKKEYVDKVVQEHERGLEYVQGKLRRVLEPGRYAIWSHPGAQVEIRTVDMRRQQVAITGQEAPYSASGS